jgi:ATP:corrinoid adenosyltransferase
VVFIVFATYYSKKRRARLEEQRQRWKDIKELEEDYDVYVSDEYAYHIADGKLPIQKLQNYEENHPLLEN